MPYEKRDGARYQTTGWLSSVGIRESTTTICDNCADRIVPFTTGTFGEKQQAYPWSWYS